MPELDRTPVLDWVHACQPGLLAWTPEPVRAIEDDEAVRLTLVELRRIAVLVEEVAHRDVDRAAAHPGRDGSDREVERILRQPVELGDLGRRRADREGAGEVR